MDLFARFTSYLATLVELPPNNTKTRVQQEKAYENSLVDRIAKEHDPVKIKELQVELMLCQRRVDGYVRVYPALSKID